MDYRLVVLIEGHDFTFSITIPRTGDVHQLRRLIYQEGQFDRLRLLDLKLYKVSVQVATDVAHR